MLAGCGAQLSGSTQTVEIDGDIVAIERLVGDWAGHFVDADSRDNGTVRFNLRTATEPGEGELIMHPNGERHALTVVAMRSLRIGSSGRVRIQLLSIGDTQCRCDIRIELNGQLSGDEMSGNYVRHRRDLNLSTDHSSTMMHSGRWSMTRR